MGDEVRLDVSFAVARDRLVRLGHSGALLGTSEDAYGPGLARVGAAGVSKLVQVQVHELTWTDRWAGLALRWEATGAVGGLFPVLDADITLAPAGQEVTVLTMTGVYRPPFGPLGQALDRAVLHRVATATVRSFLTRVAAQITGQPGPAQAAVANGAASSPPPSTPKAKA